MKVIQKQRSTEIAKLKVKQNFQKRTDLNELTENTLSLLSQKAEKIAKTPAFDYVDPMITSKDTFRHYF